MQQKGEEERRTRYYLIPYTQYTPSAAICQVGTPTGG